MNRCIGSRPISRVTTSKSFVLACVGETEKALENYRNFETSLKISNLSKSGAFVRNANIGTDFYSFTCISGFSFIFSVIDDE